MRPILRDGRLQRALGMRSCFAVKCPRPHADEPAAARDNLNALNPAASPLASDWPDSSGPLGGIAGNRTMGLRFWLFVVATAALAHAILYLADREISAGVDRLSEAKLARPDA